MKIELQAGGNVILLRPPAKMQFDRWQAP